MIKISSQSIDHRGCAMRRSRGPGATPTLLSTASEVPLTEPSTDLPDDPQRRPPQLLHGRGCDGGFCWRWVVQSAAHIRVVRDSPCPRLLGSAASHPFFCSRPTPFSSNLPRTTTTHDLVTPVAPTPNPPKSSLPLARRQCRVPAVRTGQTACQPVFLLSASPRSLPLPSPTPQHPPTPSLLSGL